MTPGLIRTEFGDGYVIVRFETDAIETPDQVHQAGGEILKAAADREGERVVVDFSELTKLASIFLGRLTLVNGALSERGVELRLCGLNPQMAEVVTICRLDRILKLYPTLEEALAP